MLKQAEQKVAAHINANVTELVMRAVAGRWCWARAARSRAASTVSLIRSRDRIAGSCKGGEIGGRSGGKLAGNSTDMKMGAYRF